MREHLAHEIRRYKLSIAREQEEIFTIFKIKLRPLKQHKEKIQTTRSVLFPEFCSFTIAEDAV